MISSLGALIGLVGGRLAIAGRILSRFRHDAVHSARGPEVTTEIFHHLLDGVDPEHLEAARHAASNVPDVQDVTVRDRWMGRSRTLEVEGRLPGETPLARAEEIGQTVEAAVRNAVEDARHITWIPRQHACVGGDPSVGGE